MRDWQLTADSPLSMRFAADVRLSQTDYADDQSWEVILGGPLEPALVIQTRYGGRAGLARLVPMFVIGSHPVYEGNALAERPTLRAFAPNYARITARPVATLGLTLELWVIDSHALGLRFGLENSTSDPLSMRLELFAQIVREGQVIDMNLLGLDDGSEALHLGVIGNLNPILLLDSAASSGARSGEHVSPKLSSPITIPANGKVVVHAIHVGLPSLNEGLQTAYQLLHQTDWDSGIRLIGHTNATSPKIETGNVDWDTALAFSQHVALRSFVAGARGTGSSGLPFPSYVSARVPSRGFSIKGDGSDHGWQWNGQTAALGYLALPTVAMAAPDLARGAIRNALAVRQPDGWIDFKPGLAGQRANMISLPLLAATAWQIYEITEDRHFIEEVFSGLHQFFERWFGKDMDRDADGLPEWSNTTQSSFPDNPTFARYRRWAQNADINKAESPDLASYLINEGRALLRMAELTGHSAALPPLRARLDQLRKQIDLMWSEEAGSYQYRDRDTDRTLGGTTLFRGKGDESFDAKIQLDPPNRLILRVIGGKDHQPRVSVTVEGVDSKGGHIAESIPPTAFAWHYGMGSAVTERVYSQVNYAQFEGVSRVYSVEIDTVDLTLHNQTLLLPLWAEVPGKARAERLVQTITDPAHYWREYGMPVCPADDPAFAPDNNSAIGSGGVWLLWNTLIIEALLHYGYTSEAMTLFSRILAAQVRSLKQDRGFHEAYNSETGAGLGDVDELSGIVPIQLVMRLIGVRVVNSRKVWAGGPYAWPNSVKVTHHEVEVMRSAEGTKVRFPSGHTADVGPEWQAIEDPTPISQTIPAASVSATPSPPAPLPQGEGEQTASVEPAPPTTPAAPNVSVVPTVPAVPTTARIIPVDAKKDDTLEIPISQIEFSPQEPKSDDNPGVIKIPVSGPDEGE
jgi:hypothetical protein